MMNADTATVSAANGIPPSSASFSILVRKNGRIAWK
jgi:hypothetical protein